MLKVTKSTKSTFNKWIQARHSVATVTVAVSRVSRCTSGHVRSCSVSHSMSHTKHGVTSLDLNGKQDVCEANSDEHAILGMKMKRELENMLLVPQFEVFHHFHHFFPNGSFWTSDESLGEQMTEQEVYMNHVKKKSVGGVGGKEAYGSQRAHLRLDVTQGLLNLLVPLENTPRKWALYLCYCCSWLWKTSVQAEA